MSKRGELLEDIRARVTLTIDPYIEDAERKYGKL